MHNRIFEFWTGGQASGKTYQLKRRIDELSRRKTIKSVFVCDRIGEYLENGQVFYKFSDYLSMDKMPRVCVFALGLEPRAYDRIFKEAITQGDVVVVIDEGYEFAPAGAQWRGCVDLQRIVLAGRHLQNCQNQMRAVHLLVATQYPRQVHHSLCSQAAVVCSSRLLGDNATDWIRGNFGQAAAAENATLKEHVFQVLRPENGKLPKN